MLVKRIIAPSLPKETIVRACNAFGIPPTEEVQSAVMGLFAELYMAGWDECSRRYEEALKEPAQ